MISAKSTVKKIGIYGFKGALKLAYAPMKLLPTEKGKVLFCSRMSKTLPLDYELLQKRLIEKTEAPGYDGEKIKIVNVLDRIGKGPREYLLFGLKTFESMYHLATSRVCVLDTYWPAVSVLKHKDGLKVVQIWHAIGKMKKTGLVAAGEAGGRDKETAQLMNMHANNDCIIAGSSVFNKYYCESFGCREDILYNYGLPRIDYLIDTEAANREKFFADHPDLKKKPIILYVPTFRRGMVSRWMDIVDAVDTDKYTLIIKNHPKQEIEGERPKEAYYFDDIDSMELLAVADYVITDYSAISLEAAILKKKTLFWVYDFDEYMEKNGLNIDLYEAAPGHISKDINDLMRIIDTGSYDMSVLEAFRDKYLPKDLGSSTDKIADLILEIVNTGKLPER